MCECSGVLGDTGRWSKRAVGLGGLLQRRPEAEWAQEAATALGRCWAELLEVRRCSGCSPEARSGPGAQQSCRSSPEKKTVVAATKS